MYELLLRAHAWLGWVAAATAVASAIAIAAPPRQWLRVLRRRGARMVALTLGVQVLAGAMLYFSFSPYTAGNRTNVDVMLRDPTLRYWNVVHPLIGILAFATLFAYRVRGSGLPIEPSRRRALLVLVIALALMTVNALTTN